MVFMQIQLHRHLCIKALTAVLVKITALLWTQSAIAADCIVLESTTAVSQRPDLVIGQVTIRSGDLFDIADPTQGQFVHSAANALHLTTREKTLSAALPFRRGDVFSLSLLAEGERILREKRYLRDAFVIAHRVCGNEVDVEVQTIDNWTLTPSLSFGSAGGENRYTIEIQDLNVLGLGKELKLRQQRRGENQESTFLYGDDNVLGSRYRLSLALGDTDDGKQYSLQGGLPFYSNESKHSWWASLNSSTKAFESLNDDSIQIPVKTEQVTLSAAKAVTGSTLPYARAGMGVRFTRQVTDTALSNEAIGIEPTHDFEELYPFITAQWSRDDWLKRQNYKSLRANEDINLGLGVDLELGLILDALGNEDDAVRLGIDLTKGWYSGEDALHTLRFQQVHYFRASDESKYEFSARYQYFRWFNANNQLDLRLTGEARRGYSPLYDYTVGGDQGLRAYRTAYQRGEQRLLGMAEYRHITSWSPWSLLHTALTGFVEVGRAWSDGDHPQTVANVGIGLLLSATRSSRAAVNRFDISVPLVDGEDVADYQIFIGTTINY